MEVYTESDRIRTCRFRRRYEPDLSLAGKLPTRITLIPICRAVRLAAQLRHKLTRLVPLIPVRGCVGSILKLAIVTQIVDRLVENFLLPVFGRNFCHNQIPTNAHLGIVIVRRDRYNIPWINLYNDNPAISTVIVRQICKTAHMKSM